jgi:hypothetical protein
MCPDGATAGDDFTPNAEFDEDPYTCKKYMDLFKTVEAESDMCELSQYIAGGYCCPTTIENPCVACPNGITAGDDFVPYAGIGYLKPCSKTIEDLRLLDAEHSLCGAEKEWEEALCCPTTPKNPCDICPGGLTAADDFFPPGDGQTCKQNIDTLMLMETESVACSEWGPFYKATCCPEASTAVTTTSSTASTDSTSSGATFTSATGNSELIATTATVIPSTEPIPSGGVIVFELRGFAFISSVSMILSFFYV